ncbi:MAG: AAA domain-containing protein [Verrucomicrobiales bacterium]
MTESDPSATAAAAAVENAPPAAAQTFREFWAERQANGGFSTEDALVAFLPLARQVAATHAEGLVAPLRGIEALHASAGSIWFHEAARGEPTLAPEALAAVESQAPRAVDVAGRYREEIDGETGAAVLRDSQVGAGDAGSPAQPAFLPGFVSWEQQLGHHDPLADVFVLGLILAALSCGIDFSDPAAVERFAGARANLFQLNAGLHPVIAKAIVRMTELDRRRRPRDAAAIAAALENYREQPVDFGTALAREAGFQTSPREGKRALILGKLQERLFEISRRNRLLHFRQTLQTANLTAASVPISLSIENIRPGEILTWGGPLEERACGHGDINLNRYLRFEEAQYLPGVLDRIRLEAGRDEREFGFAQLRLVIAFLNWANPKAPAEGRFDSPLALVPVKLVKRTGVRDSFLLQIVDANAQINPVLRYQFKRLFAIDLPESVALEPGAMERFHAFLNAQIQASEPGVELHCIDRPRIDLIYSQAVRRQRDYERRTGKRRDEPDAPPEDPAEDGEEDPAARAFEDRLKAAQAQVAALAKADPDTDTDTEAEADPGLEKSKGPSAPEPEPAPESKPEPDPAPRERYRLRGGGEHDNPFAWEFDLCRVTLGNFRYRKMSLVRDYEALLGEPIPNDAFDAVFSLAPKDADPNPPAPPLAERFHVVPCDPTQASSISRARAGRSYIIQGPPGTGKSQTITNLIADYAARGKRVLFVCEKRAAIDVVFHRLKQLGLDALGCLIHDSQADKKAFVADLKGTYEAFLAWEGAAEECERDRGDWIAKIERDLRPLADFDEAMLSAPDEAGTRVRSVVERAVALRGRQPDLGVGEAGRVPLYASWEQGRASLAAFTETLADLRDDLVFARHPLSLLAPEVAEAERPHALVEERLRLARERLAKLRAALAGAQDPADCFESLAAAKESIHYARWVRFLAERDLMALLSPGSEVARTYAEGGKAIDRCRLAFENAAAKNSAWREKLDPGDTAAALDQARALGSSALNFLKLAWWRLRKVLQARYDFSRHAVAPAWESLLAALHAEHEAAAALAGAQRELAERLGLSGDPAAFCREVDELQALCSALPPRVAPLHAALLHDPQAKQQVAAIIEAGQHLEPMEAALAGVAEIDDALRLDEIEARLANAAGALGDLPDFLFCLQELGNLPPDLAAALRLLPLAPDQVEAAAAGRTLERLFRRSRALAKFTARTRGKFAARLAQGYRALAAANARAVSARVRGQFLDHVRVSGLPAAQLDAGEKEFKKRYARGRRELEHEFGKSMRHRAIRDLASGDTGLVLRDLKPIWLMSPLSVSDTLPLDPGFFDVVIFDEASQVTLEEAVPSLFRAAQAIVVGDEMQLPPTNFFAAKQGGSDGGGSDVIEVEDEDGGTAEYDLGGDSLLNHASLNLPSTMLGWHYRSRSESLISFSNAAFYSGNLLTVPEEQLADAALAGEIAAPAEGDAVAGSVAGADALLARPVSFHFMEGGTYELRRNRREADYIAGMIRAIVMRPGEAFRPTIGVVAFSEAQQGEIDAALGRLADGDRAFAAALEQEYEREEDGQYVGLLVKNLENIQGDERDIIILSVCYGYGPPDAKGRRRMRMNFRPINQSGGEKRLNVAFSRAKHHMAVVSSIRYGDITNEYNDGANCLRNYLRYAEAWSKGDAPGAASVLEAMLPPAARSRGRTGMPDAPPARRSPPPCARAAMRWRSASGKAISAATSRCSDPATRSIGSAF